MPKSTSLGRLLPIVQAEARRRGLSDARWCEAAGVRKETLSRLRGRTNCDLATLDSLAAAVGERLDVVAAEDEALSEDGHLPVAVGRAYEERLANLVVSANYNPHAWRAAGPGFFMAGIAVLAASVHGFDRRRLLALAEQLHPGSSNSEVFALWLRRSPVRPSRFAPQLRQGLRRAA